MSESRPDILLYFSDQHHGLCAGYAGHPVVQTPNLDRLAGEGVACETAYTSCPLCVPARAGLLTGQLPSHNNVYDNHHIIPSDQATFLHALAAEGYQTVLCGRMHFKGADQRHGFTRRVFGDITSMYTGGIADGGVFGRTFGMGGCADLVGAGTSPVLEYDRAVIRAATDYLRRRHDKPQCIVVGTYGPHFSYVAPPELFEMYRDGVAAPPSWDPEGRDPNPMLDAKRQRTRRCCWDGQEEPVSTEIMLAARAAYFGMITEQDRHVGTIRQLWQEHLDRSGRQGVFVYGSDHGDTCGEHGIFGKQTFYEGSARIPLVFAGAGIPAGARVREPTSILDIAPTLCELGGAQAPPAQDGVSLLGALRGRTRLDDRCVLCEWVQYFRRQAVAARMVRAGRWKLTRYDHDEMPDQLFDLDADPDELTDRAGDRPDQVRRLGELLERGWEPDRVAARYAEKSAHVSMLHRCYRADPPDEPTTEKWRIPDTALARPEVVI
ncbi:MAG: sulfatase-like hydrolase/transferase [Planctomycetota bacterium]